MALAVGSRLGHYEVTALIGEGGMGQVYQATDTKLNRQVALKILPEAFASDPDRLARFEREAQVLASLNHPNIAQIHGLKESDDTRALVLELVDGPTLADRIKQGPIPVDETLLIAKQIAEALEAAHEAGVIHRDLKPANIKVRDDGSVKVLDFGLARGIEGEGTVGNLSDTPPATVMATATGVILGTAGYMSPEQAKGKAVDRRADVWAFGTVLYEMLTGQRAFAGDEVSESLVAVLTTDVDLDRLPSDVPARLRQVLVTCLRKDPKQRVRDIGDVRLAMEGAFESAVRSVSASAADATASSSWRRALPWVVGAVLATMAGSGVWLSTRPPTPLPTQFAVSVPASVAAGGGGFGVSPGGVAVSPNGRILVFAAGDIGSERLYVRRLDAVEATAIPGTEGAGQPFFSRDGEWVGFLQQERLRKVSFDGRPPVTLCDLTDYLYGASWGPNDTVVFSVREALWRVSANGGDPELIPRNGSDTSLRARWVDVLPDGDAALVSMWAGLDLAQIALVDLDSGEHQALTPGTFPRYSPTGHIVYWREGSLWAVPFDADRRTLTGVGVPAVSNVGVNAGGFAHFAVSRGGTLAYMEVPEGRITATLELVWVDRDGQETAIPAPPKCYLQPRISPDGTQLAVAVTGDEDSDLWVYDLERNASHRLTFDRAAESSPVWMPDGSTIAFFSAGDPSGVYGRSADGTGDAQLLVEGDYEPTSVTPDGSHLLLNGSGGVSLVALDGDSAPTELVNDLEFLEQDAVVSPDGRWLAYVANGSGDDEVYVRPFPNVESGFWQLSDDGGWGPRWSPDGRALYFRDGESLMQVAVSGRVPSSWEMAGRLFDDSYAWVAGVTYDIAPDGERFVMSRILDDAAPRSLIVVERWATWLTRHAPVD